MRSLLVAGALVLAACSPVSTAWFGVKTPPGLQAPPQLANMPEAPAATVPDGDPTFDGARIREDLQTIVSFADEMEKTSQFWGRISGYPSEAMTADWVADQLRAAGVQDVDVQTYASDSDFWFPKSWEARVLADPAFGRGTEDVVLASAVPTAGSQIAAPITAPLVYAGEAGETPSVEVTGKIAIQHSRPTTGAYSDRAKIRESAQALHDAGAVAVINWIEQDGNMHVFDFGGCGGPCFNVGGADGAFLKAVLDKARDVPVTMRLSLDAEMVPNLTAKNVIGVIPGENTEQAIIVNAHMDSWFAGAGDNGDGLAVMLALARYYGDPAHKPARSLIFVGSGGHHSRGMNGPGHLLPMNRPLLSKAVLVLNLEHVAQYQFITDPAWHVDPTEEPKKVGVSDMAPFLVQTLKDGAARYGYTYDPEITNSVPGDLGGYAPLKVARVQGIHSGPLYHTSGDQVPSISVPGLARAANFYRYFIDAAASAPADQINPPAK